MATGAEQSRREQAAEWFARLNQRAVRSADIEAFSTWRKDPDNARSFAAIEAAWDAAGSLSGDPAVDELTRQALNRRTGPVRRTGLRATAIATMGAVALGAGIAIWTSAPQVEKNATRTGETRTMALADGSLMILDSASEAEVHYTSGQRTIELVSGRANFAVRPDPTRPFIVEAGHTRITALGTRFDVERLGVGARVVLSEGQVSVSKDAGSTSRWTLRPGQQISTASLSPRVVEIDPAAATSWTTGRLTFSGTPLGDAVNEMNRYSRRKIELQGADLAAVQVSGVFDATDTDGFVGAVAALYPVSARHVGEDRIILRPEK